MMNVYHKWQPITDLEVAPELLADDGLRTMLLVWQEQKDSIATPEEMRTFNEKLRREWALETGLIERIYTLDRGITELLIERGIDEALIPYQPGRQLPEKTAAILRDHEHVIDGLFDFVARRQDLTTSYIKELHAALVRNQGTATGVDQFGNKTEVELIKGDYKSRPNNPTRADGKEHEYCPPEHVASEMDNLVKMHGEHNAKGIAPEISAAWLHHRFTQIHPFQDGNGRVARCLATIIFLRAGGFPVIIRDINGNREKYLDALESADRGDLQPLVSVFAAAQRREFSKAINISREILEGTPQETAEEHQARTKMIIKSAAQKFTARTEQQNKEWVQAQSIAKNLHRLSVDALKQTEGNLNDDFASYPGSGDLFRTDSFSEGDLDDRGHYFRQQIIDVARELGYFASTATHHEWTRLTLHPGKGRAELLVSFHGVGHSYRGVLVCSVSFFRRERTSAEERQVSTAIPLTDEVFQINYQDSEDLVKERFRPWLEKAIGRGLAFWHKSL